MQCSNEPCTVICIHRRKQTSGLDAIFDQRLYERSGFSWNEFSSANYDRRNGEDTNNSLNIATYGARTNELSPDQTCLSGLTYTCKQPLVLLSLSSGHHRHRCNVVVGPGTDSPAYVWFDPRTFQQIDNCYSKFRSP